MTFDDQRFGDGARYKAASAAELTEGNRAADSVGALCDEVNALQTQLIIALEALLLYRCIPGSDCDNKTTKYSAAEAALVEIARLRGKA